MQIVVLGYYQRDNLGDTIYTLTMPKLFPNYQLTFYNPDDLMTIPAGTTAVVCGGGDLMNGYFRDRLMALCKDFTGKKIALSVGISFESFRDNDCLTIFDQIFLRNKTDVRYLQSKFGSEVVHYLPDLAFLLETTGLHSKHWSKFQLNPTRRPKLGLFYIASMTSSKTRINQLIQLTGQLSHIYNVRLYRFNTSKQINEDDDILNQTILKALTESTSIKVKSKVYSVQQMLRVFSRLDLAICMRYHAHIMATLTGTPFLSLSATRKTELFMQESGLATSLYRIPRNRFGDPESIDITAILDRLQQIWEGRDVLRSTLLSISTINRSLLSTVQPQTLLTSIRQLNPQLPQAQSVNHLYDRVRSFIMTETGHDIITGPPPSHKWHPSIIRRVAEFMSFVVTHSPMSEFIHGTIENLTHRAHELYGMLDYMVKNYRPRHGKFNLTYIDQNITHGLHRSGWQYIVDALMALNDPRGVLLDTYVDRTFHWAEDTLHRHGVIPYTVPWVGIIHHTPLVEYSDYNTVAMLKKNTFLQSLPMCYGFYVLSPSLATWLQRALTEIGWGHIPIETLVHPTEFVPTVFTMTRYYHNHHKKLVQIGAWLRNTFSIYEVHLDPEKKIQKYVLRGPHMDNYLIPRSFTLQHKHGQWIYTSHHHSQVIDICRSDISRSPATTEHAINMCRTQSLNKWVVGFFDYLMSHQSELTFRKMTYDASQTPKVKIKGASGSDKAVAHTIEKLIDSVTIQPTLSNQEYDHWLSANIVFVNLVDCSAVNTVIECIVRNTPIVINRIPQTIQILGENYPLFYTSVDEVDSLLTHDNIAAATHYLGSLDKEPYRIETFIRTIKNGAIYQSLDP